MSQRTKINTTPVDNQLQACHSAKRMSAGPQGAGSRNNAALPGDGDSSGKPGQVSVQIHKDIKTLCRYDIQPPTSIHADPEFFCLWENLWVSSELELMLLSLRQGDIYLWFLGLSSKLITHFWKSHHSNRAKRCRAFSTGTGTVHTTVRRTRSQYLMMFSDIQGYNQASCHGRQTSKSICALLGWGRENMHHADPLTGTRSCGCARE